MSAAIAAEEIPECTQALLDVLVPEEDLQKYAQIEERIRQSEEQRHQQLEEAQSHIKVLSHTLAQLRSTSTRDAANWKSESEHQQEMDQLQSKHFDLVKKINDDEAKVRAVEIELEELAKNLEGLDQVDVESQEEMDKDAIAGGLFRKMGFVPCYLKTDDPANQVSTEFESLMVRSETKNRSTEFEVNDDMMRAKAITPYILANQLWQASE